ncbi:TPA: condensation domain-containing protein, partial [Staphylococcus pseudintermedius]
HHIIMDGWSSNIFINKIFNAYVGNEIKDNNKQVNASFKDYIEHLNITDDTASELFWENYLRNYNNTVTIPYEKKTNNDIKDTKCHEFYIGEENTARLNDIAQKNNVTLSTVFSVIWGILLQKYNNVDDVVFGAITSGRTVPIENIDKIIGPFINTIPMRIKAEMDETFNTLVYKVQKELNKMKDHENHPLYKIQNTSI